MSQTLTKRPYLYALNDDLIAEFLRDPNYRILETGEIYSSFDAGGHPSSAWRRCDTLHARSGYRRVNYRGKKLPAHRIVFLKFVGPLDPALHINHIDGNKGRNAVSNLELVTPAQNNLHAFRVLGKAPCGGRPRKKEMLNG